MNALDYVAIEGPIGVGKTTLATRLAASLGAELLREAPEENPFLKSFYDDRNAYAFQAQLFFLLQRARQIEGLGQRDLFNGRRVTDFMFEKDPLFAHLNLSGPELALYDDVYRRLSWEAPKPDKVIYLYAPVDTLITRVQKRARWEEQALEPDYLVQVADRYAEFFQNYSDVPLVTVNAVQRNLVDCEADYQALLDALTNPVPRVDL